MYKKQNWLAIDSENLAKIYITEIKELVNSGVARVTKKRGPQNEGKFHYVTENKWRKNVSFPAFQDVVEKKRVIVFFP
ncbi:MAG: hypothetical protein ABSF14_03775 [Terriglobia bacterium]|jgi:hypothetical protein